MYFPTGAVAVAFYATEWWRPPPTVVARFYDPPFGPYGEPEPVRQEVVRLEIFEPDPRLRAQKLSEVPAARE